MPLKSVLHLFQLSYPTFINTNRLLATNFEDVIHCTIVDDYEEYSLHSESD